jgi:glyoxylate reductase
MDTVFITRRIPEKAIRLLKNHFSVKVNKRERNLYKYEIIAGVRGSFGLLSLLTDRIDSEVISAGKKLRIIANFAVGYDNIDITKAAEKGIIVTNTPGILTKTTAELAWALLFATARRIVEGDSFTRKGKFKGWEPTLLLGFDIHGKTLGVIGAGRIGTEFALGAVGFDMRVLYYDRQRNPTIEKKLGAKRVALKKLLQSSDFISIHTPLTQETHHLIGKEEIGMMKKNAILINTSRGPVLDEEALTDGLVKGTIAGAGLDVYEKEPSLTKRLRNCTNAVLTPHIGSASYETREKMAVMAAQSIIDVYKGKRPAHCVNRIQKKK